MFVMFCDVGMLVVMEVSRDCWLGDPTDPFIWNLFPDMRQYGAILSPHHGCGHTEIAWVQEVCMQRSTAEDGAMWMRVTQLTSDCWMVHFQI